MNRFGKISRKIGLEKGLIQVTVGNTAGSLIGAIFWLFIASILLVEDYGKVNYYLSLASMLSVFSLLGLNTTITTFLAKGNENLKHQANLLVLISNCIILVFLIIFVPYLPAALLLIGMSFYTMSWAEILAHRNYKQYSIVVISQRVLQVVLSLLLYLLMGIDGIIIGFGLSTTIFAYNYFRSLKSLSFELGDLRQKFHFVIHSYAAAMSNSITIYADKLLIAPLFGFTVLGLYQISFQFLIFLSIIPMSMFQFLLPRESAQIEGKKYAITGLVTAIAFSIIFFFAIPFIVNSLFPHFIESTQSAQIMIFGVIPMTANSIILSRLFGKEKSKPIFIAAITYIFTLTILIFFLGRSLGLVGLASSVLASLIVQTTTLIIASKLDTHNKANENNNAVP